MLSSEESTTDLIVNITKNEGKIIHC